jgi:hypothetical protein
MKHYLRPFFSSLNSYYYPYYALNAINAKSY